MGVENKGVWRTKGCLLSIEQVQTANIELMRCEMEATGNQYLYSESVMLLPRS
jgi:hypothetical protein